jgi:hypothetical protein
MKKSVVIGIICCLAIIGILETSLVAEQEKKKTPEPDIITLQAFGSLTAKPSTYSYTYDSISGAKFGMKVVDADPTNYFISAYVAQFPTKGNQIVKTFAGLPFVVNSLVADKDVELSEQIRITLVGGAKQMAWKNTNLSRQPGQNKNTGNIFIEERYLSSPKIWENLAKSSVILPSENSEVPCLCDNEGFPSKVVPTAIGIVWVFEKTGTEIHIGTELYHAIKEGATIEFTASGPIMKDVVKTRLQK